MRPFCSLFSQLLKLFSPGRVPGPGQAALCRAACSRRHLLGSVIVASALPPGFRVRKQLQTMRHRLNAASPD